MNIASAVRSYEWHQEAGRQLAEEQAARYEEALDAEIERIECNPEEIKEALGYVADYELVEREMIKTIYGSPLEQRLAKGVLKQVVSDGVCELARANLRQREAV